MMENSLKVYYVFSGRQVNGALKMWYESGPYYTLADAISAKKGNDSLIIGSVDLPVTVIF